MGQRKTWREESGKRPLLSGALHRIRFRLTTKPSVCPVSRNPWRTSRNRCCGTVCWPAKAERSSSDTKVAHQASLPRRQTSRLGSFHGCADRIRAATCRAAATFSNRSAVLSPQRAPRSIVQSGRRSRSGYIAIPDLIVVRDLSAFHRDTRHVLLRIRVLRRSELNAMKNGPGRAHMGLVLANFLKGDEAAAQASLGQALQANAHFGKALLGQFRKQVDNPLGGPPRQPRRGRRLRPDLRRRLGRQVQGVPGPGAGAGHRGRGARARTGRRGGR